MKVILKKRRGISVYDVYKDGLKTKYTVSKENFLSSSYYLVYYGKRLSGRFPDLPEVRKHLAVKFLDEMAEKILEK